MGPRPGTVGALQDLSPHPPHTSIWAIVTTKSCPGTVSVSGGQNSSSLEQLMITRISLKPMAIGGVEVEMFIYVTLSIIKKNKRCHVDYT